MALDSLLIAGLANELNRVLEGARIDKIYMPRRDRVVLNLRLQQGSGKLLLAAGGDARVHLTEEKFDNPDVPPMLCMLLRKQLSSGRFLRATQPEGERILDLCFSAADEMGFIGEKHLICELTGRLTNVILTDSEGLILGCMKPVDHEMSDRAVLPGLRYRLPPKPEKPSLADLSLQQLTELCRQAEQPRDLCGLVAGVSPLCARECQHRAGGDAALWAEELKKLVTLAPAPYLLQKAGGAPADISAMEITCRDDITCTLQPSFSALLDAFYLQRSREEGLKNASQQLVRNITTLKSRLQRKLAAQEQELHSAVQREKLKEQADLITANLYAIQQGDSKAVVVDYFAEGMPMREIPLDPLLSPQENAQRLYHKYTRMKRAEEVLLQQIEQGEQELAYLEAVLYSFSAAKDLRQIEDVREELVENGYLRNKDKQKKKPKPAAFAPRSFTVDGGLTALCGRNNRENDQLTHRHAGKNDIWFHARNIPGSHVILFTEGTEPSDKALEQAAAIAAYYCATANQPRVPVDYTKVRHVKKPQGAKPGMVNYFEYKTALVAPALPQGGEQP